jgi:hypothetical protein
LFPSHDQDLDYTPSSAVEFYDSPNNVWVKWQILYNTGDGSDASAQLATTKLATKGWAYGFEGENADNVKTVDYAEMKTVNGGFAIIPVYRDEVSSTTFNVVSYPSNSISTYSLSATTDSSELVTYALIDTTIGDDDYFEVKRGSTTLAILHPVNECKFTPYVVLFQNRYGCIEQIVFFKERTDNLNITRESYETASGQPKDGVHQFKTYNVKGSRAISLSTGFMYESNNDKIEQLLLSERIWLYEPSNPLTKAVNVETPVNIKDTSTQLKTRLNDKLINYTVEFEYAFNLINNI